MSVALDTFMQELDEWNESEAATARSERLLESLGKLAAIDEDKVCAGTLADLAARRWTARALELASMPAHAQMLRSMPFCSAAEADLVESILQQFFIIARRHPSQSMLCQQASYVAGHASDSVDTAWREKDGRSTDSSIRAAARAALALLGMDSSLVPEITQDIASINGETP